MQRNPILFVPAFFCGVTFLASAMAFLGHPWFEKAQEGILAVAAGALTALFVWLAMKPTRASAMRQKEEEELKAAADMITRIEDWPVVENPVSIILWPGEVCYFQRDASVEIVKNQVVGSTGGYGGISFRVARGVTLHSGNTARKVVRSDVQYTYRGVFSLTNQRVIMTGEKGFEYPIDKITAVSPYRFGAGLMLQFGKSSYTVLMKTPYLVPKVLSLMASVK